MKWVFSIKWIKCSDEMPDSHTPVVFWYNDEAHIGYFCEKSKHTGEYLWQSHIDGYNCVSNVELWMPLPPSPKD